MCLSSLIPLPQHRVPLAVFRDSFSGRRFGCEGLAGASASNLVCGRGWRCASFGPGLSDRVEARLDSRLVTAVRRPVGQRCGGAFFAELQLQHVFAGGGGLALRVCLVFSR